MNGAPERCPKCGSSNIIGYMGEYECMDCGYKFRLKPEISRKRYVTQETAPPARKNRSLKRIFALVLAFIIVFSFGLILGYGAGLSNVYTKTITVTKTVTESHTISQTAIISPSTSASQSSISQQTSEVITLREVKIHVEPQLIDGIGVYYSLKVHNNVNKSITYQAILKVNGKELVCTGIAGPYEDDVCSIQSYDAIYLDRPIGVREFQGELLIVNSSERSELFMKKELKLKIPTVKFGETIPPEELNFMYSEYEDVQVKLVSWYECEENCEIPSSDNRSYVFNPSSQDMKLIILKLEFTNVGSRIRYVPLISKGEIATTKGNIYPLIGHHLLKSRLLQGESGIEYLLFEVRKEENAIEALLPGIPYLIVFQEVVSGDEE